MSDAATTDTTPTEDARARRQPSLARRFFVALAVLSAVAAVAVLVCSSLIYQSASVDDAGKMLERECRIVRSALSGSDVDVMRLTSFASQDVRVTLVASDGNVLYDNQNNVAEMPNHADRPEIVQALQTGAGAAERDSETSGYVSIYRAVRLSNGNVVRLAVDRDGAMTAIKHDMLLVCTVVAAVVLLCWAASRLVADRLVAPIDAIDPADPEPHSSYVELEPLIERISDQVEELRGADLMRREFTSNVTHELKTPLSSIQGAAELIRDGIARSEDVPEFAGRIYDEAHHMTELVNDILTLSKLDESERSGDQSLLGSVEPVDLGRTVSEVARRLAPAAEAAGVEIAATGESCVVRGMPHLLDELVYNLCDNAIRYNREGGFVDVSARIEDGRPVVVVADSGRGIPTAQQGKVFERFYRVDASRSRDTGGTGLGLAIVKHAAMLHGAELTLDSEEGRGTTICVRFPAESLVSTLGE